jgi:hypothetical protein
MKTFELKRTYSTDRTTGTLTGPNGYTGTTLERPWLNNRVSVSCIPEGTYQVRRDRVGRFTWFAVQNVPGRTNIEFHLGTLPTHSEGCILMSLLDLQDLLLETQGQPFTLVIKKA